MQLEADLATIREEATQEREAAEAARMEQAKAQLRLEALPILEGEKGRLQAALDAERTARADTERHTAAAEAKVAGLADRLADARAQHQQAVASLEKQLQEQKQRGEEMVGRPEGDKQCLEAELSESRKEARAMAILVGKLQGQVEALQGQRAAS